MRTAWWRKLLGILGRPAERRRPYRRSSGLCIEALENRLAPAATITSTATAFTIDIPTGETATLSIAAGQYVVTDPSGISGTSTGGALSGGNTIFTSNFAASGQNPFTIDATSAGTLQLAGNNVIPTTASLAVNGGTFDLDGDAEAIDALSGSGTVTNSGAANTLTIGSSGGGGTFSGAFTGALNLLKTGAGTEIISGSSSITGNTEVNAGTLQAGAANIFSSSSPLIVDGTGTVDLAGFAQAVASLSNNGAATAQIINSGSAANFTDAGNWSFVGSSFSINGGKLIFSSAGTQTFDPGTASFGAVQHTGAGTLQLVNHGLTLTGNLDNEAGVIDLNGNNLSVAGTVTNKGSIQLEGSETVTLSHGNDVTEGTWLYYGNNSAGPVTIANFGATDYFNLSIDDTNATAATYEPKATLGIAGALTVLGGTFAANGQTVSITSGLTVNGGVFTGGSGTVNTGGVTLLSGTLTAPSSSGAFNVSGNWSKTGGTFTANGGTVTLTGTGQSIGGASTFFNLSKTVTSADTLTFGAGATNKTTVTGALTLEGATGQLLSLRSATTGTQWQINPQGTRTVDFVNVKDSQNTSTLAIVAADSTAAGDNTHWAFFTPPGNLIYASTGGTVTLKEVGGNIELFDTNNNLVEAIPAAAANSVTVDGLPNATNTLVIDYSGGTFTLAGGITFNGGALGTNTLEITGGSFTTDTYNYTDANDGSITLDTQTITYTQLTPIINTGTAANVVLNLPATASNALLENNGAAILLHSNNSTFEDTTFANPTASLTINRGNSADTVDVTVTSPTNFSASLTIGSVLDPFATATIDDPLKLNTGAGNLAIDADTINVNANIDTSGGTTGSVSFAEGTALNIAVGANITANGSVSQTGAGAATLGGNITTSAANVRFAAAVSVNAAVQIATSGTGAGAGDITFASVDDADAVPTNSLTLKPGSSTARVGAVGASQPLLAFDAAPGSSGTTSLTQSVSADTVTLSGNVSIAGTLDISYTGAAGLSASGGTITLGGHALAFTDANSTDTGSIASKITGAGSITKIGPGTLTLSNTGNNYSDGTNVLAGTLQAGAANAIPTGTTLTLGDSVGNTSGTFDLDGHAQTVASVGVSGTGTGNTVTDSAAAATFTLNISAGTDTYAGLFTGALALAKQGGGKLTLSNNANTYTGGTSVTRGTLAFSDDGDLGSAVAGNTIAIGAATLQATAVVTLNALRAITITAAGTSIQETVAGSTLTIDGAITGSFTLNLFGPGNITLNGGADITSATGDGIDLRPGGDIKTAVFILDDCTISGNSGAGIQVFTGAGNVTVNNSTISGNSAGGINVDDTFNNTLALNDDTVSGNQATGENGGGLAIFTGSLSLVNDTFDSNTTTLAGGGVYFASTGALTILNCTIANNSASSGGGLFSTNTGTTTVTNTIIAQNSAATGPDVDGQIPAAVSFNNLLGKAAGLAAGSITNGINGNQIGTIAAPINPLLATLGNYGGPTETDALLPGSPALDTGDNAGVPATDQRGDSRIVNTIVDIGAFESGGFNVAPQGAPAAGTNRALIGQFFVSPTDGTTQTSFQVLVTPVNPGEPVAGGVIHFTATPGANSDSATPQTPSAAISAGGFAATTALANGFFSPTTGATYQLNASPGGENPVGAFNLYNQHVASLSYNIPGGNGTVAPQNTQSGSVTQLKSNGITSPTFTLTLLDQEPSPQTVAINGQTVSVRAIYGVGAITAATDTTPIRITSVAHGLVTGQQITISGVLGNTHANGTYTVTVINANTFSLNGSKGNGIYVAHTGTFEKGYINGIATPAGAFPAVTLTGGVASTTTVLGVATFANLQVFQSVYSTPYVLKGYFTNPAPDNSQATFTTSTFRVLPYEFLVTGGNFAGLLQTAYNVSLAGSTRGTVRLLSITSASGLKTNQLRIQAFDYVSGAEAKNNVVLTPSTLYNGPVYLTFNVTATLLAPHLVFAPNVPTLVPTDMTAGVLVLNNVTVTGVVPATGFTVRADFGLTAGVPPAVAPLLLDAAGFADVNDGVPTKRIVAVFLLSNLGRLRGR